MLGRRSKNRKAKTKEQEVFRKLVMDHRGTGNDSVQETTTQDHASDSSQTIAPNFRFTFDFAPGSNKGSFIEAEASPDDGDYSESLSESVQAYPEEYGRTYHAYRAGSYAFPNDLPERERLALQHAAIGLLFNNNLYFAPLSKTYPPRRILDIATGTGEWAIEMGDEFPNSQITATDLSPIQPEEVPPNVTFFVEDSSEDWEYSMPFDYIHTRVTAGCWSSFRDQIAAQALDALNPGGWFESQEFDGFYGCDDGTMPPDCALVRWMDDIRAASETIDRPVLMARYLRKAYEEVGFVDVQEKLFKIPSNGWPKDGRLKEVGRMWEHNFSLGLSGFSSYLFNKVLKRSPAEIEVSLVDVRRDLSNPRIHAYIPMYVVWGRKPYPGEKIPPRPS